ncbi:MAG: hypothetical protein ACK4SX_05705 [Alcanivoracaceae bacterium]
MKRLLFIGLIALSASCSNSRPDQGGFYSWVDAQGNLVTVPREAETSPQEASAAAPDEEGDGEPYLTDEEISSRLEERERDRFVVYTDASGYRVVQQVDVVEARKTREEALAGRSERLDDQAQLYVERMEGIPADCCRELLARAATLKPGAELLFSFERGPWQWVRVPELRPAAAIRLSADVSMVRFQSFLLPKGYLHPQALFLDADGQPMLLVDNLFVRRYPETWYRHGSLEGEVPVEAGATWLVIYLGYAGQSASGRPALVPGAYYWREPSSPLAVQGELTVRGLAVTVEP